MPVAAEITLYAPDDEAFTNSNSVTFDYYLNINNTTNCKLIIDSIMNMSSMTLENPGFNSFTTNINPGAHTWSVQCDTLNATETSEQRYITVDVMEPTIVLFFPVNNTQINESNVDFNFVAIDNYGTELTCDILINNTIEKTVTVTNSEPEITNIDNIEDGTYTWHIICKDIANNSETSNTRIFRIDTTTQDPEFSITIPKQEYTPGEAGLMTISAPNGASIRVEICPDQSGFVECDVPVNAQNVMNYPFQEYLSFTNSAGKYILEALFNYSGYIETQMLHYEILNNIGIEIETDEVARRNVPFNMEADATGGLGTLNYTWHLSNGSTVKNKEVEITYGTAGNFTETIIVKDQYNNTNNQSIVIWVRDSVLIDILVKDSVRGTVLKDATVEIEDQQKITGTNGIVSFYVRTGMRKAMVLRENYSIFNEDLNITKAETFTIQLEPLEQANIPIVTLISPADKSQITGSSNDLKFKAEHSADLTCNVYINENNDGFFIDLGDVDVKDSSEKTFGVIELENKTYWWNVECKDSAGKTGTSSTWEFTVGAPSAEAVTLQQDPTEYAEYDEWVKEYEFILDTIEKLTKQEKEAADALGISGKIKDSIAVFKNTIRDLDGLQFRDDLTEEEKEAMRKELIINAEEAYQKTPVSFELVKSENYVDYIKKEELEALVDEYLELKGISEEVNKKKILAFLEALQQEVVISTTITNARLSYKDGSQKEITAVIRDVKVYNLTDGTVIIEIIPKEIIQSAQEVISAQEFKIIKDDPLISFGLKGDTKITYYFEKNIDLEQIKKIKTAVFIELEELSENQITGFAARSSGGPKIKIIFFLPILIILLGGLVFGAVRYNGIDTVKYALYKLQGQKSLHYINVILSDIHDHLDAGNHEQAIDLYDEAKGAYSELSTHAKNDVYENIVETAAKIQSHTQQTQTHEPGMNRIKEMIGNITTLLTNGELHPALEEYKQIEHLYHQFDDSTKEILHPTLTALGNKIQIFIENEKDKI